VSWSDFVRRHAQGHVLVDTRMIGPAMEPGRGLCGEALPPHSLDNVGSTVLGIMSTEIKPVDFVQPLTCDGAVGMSRSRRFRASYVRVGGTCGQVSRRRHGFSWAERESGR
jgi:hypothetical protein